MPSLWHYNRRAGAEKVNVNQPKPVRDYSFSHTRFLSLLRHIGFPLHFRTGAPAPKISRSQAFFQEIFGESVSRETLKSWHDFFLKSSRVQKLIPVKNSQYQSFYYCSQRVSIRHRCKHF